MTVDGRWMRVPASSELAVSRRQALGTTVDLVVHPHDALEAAQAALDSLLEVLDRSANRFRADSELSQLNRAAGTACQVGPLLAELLEIAIDAARATDGLVDPTVGGPLVAAGYAGDFAQMPGEQSAPLVASKLNWSWRRVHIHGETVELERGLLLDLGATAKAWGADRAAANIAASVGGSVLVSLGGDLSTAGPHPAGGWVVRVADDHRPEPGAPGQNVTLTAPALATSSTTQRRWTRGGHRMHHIIDPRTGMPADGPWRTVSVAGRSCVAANTASTAAIVAGWDAPRWLGERGLPARLVSCSGSVLHVGGWPSEGDEMPRLQVEARLVPEIT